MTIIIKWTVFHSLISQIFNSPTGSPSKKDPKELELFPFLKITQLPHFGIYFAYLSQPVEG